MEFYSEIWWGRSRGVCERIVLTREEKESLGRYALYGTILFTGPLLQQVVAYLLHLQAAEPKITRSHRTPPPFMWSLSVIEPRVEGMADSTGGKTAVLRVCGEGEGVRDWLKETLAQGGMEDLVGGEMWERAMG